MTLTVCVGVVWLAVFAITFAVLIRGAAPDDCDLPPLTDRQSPDADQTPQIVTTCTTSQLPGDPHAYPPEVSKAIRKANADPTFAPAAYLAGYDIPPGVPVFSFGDFRTPVDAPAVKMRYMCLCGNCEHHVHLHSWWDAVMSWECPACHSRTHGCVFTAALSLARTIVLQDVSRKAVMS